METPDDTSRLDYYGAFSHAIDVKDLKPGDHIYCHRSALFFYSHHGIYVGEPDCEVIHFSGIPDSKIGSSSDSSLDDETKLLLQELQTLPKDSKRAKEIEKKLKIGIKSTTLAEFQYGSTLRLVAYGCSGTKQFFAAAMISTHCIKAMPPSETVKLAKHFRDHPEEWEEYHLKHNNSETFACFCKTGLQDIAAQFYQFERSVFTEKDKEPCKTFEKALEKYREKP